jgi:hypothetical protein
MALSGRNMNGMLKPMDVKKFEMANMRKTGFFSNDISIIW